MAERVEALRLLEEDPSTSSDAILAALEDDAPEVRAQAASAATLAGESRAISSLLDLAAAKEPAEREAAIRALARSGAPRAQATLEQGLQDASPAVRIAAAESLASFARSGAFDSAKLAPLLSADDPLQRLAAVQLLDDVSGGDAARSSQLRKAARDKAPEVRAAALRALGHLRDLRVLPDLQSALSDADESVRLWAIGALGDSNLSGAVSPLRARASGADVRAAQMALAALSRIDDAGAVPAIASQLIQPPLAQSAADALISRVRRVRDGSAFRESCEALRRAIEAARDDEVLVVLARALVELTPFAAELATAAPQLGAAHDSQLAAAQHSLLQALASGRGDVRALTQCLIELREPKLLPALIARHDQLTPLARPSLASERAALFDALIAALQASDDAAALLAEHATQLKRLTEQSNVQLTAAASLVQLRSLLGQDTAQAEQSPELRRALAEMWAAIPALDAPKRSERLLAWLDDPDEGVRERSSVALARAAGPAELAALATRLEQHAPYPVLTLQACAGALLRTAAALSPSVRERLLQQLKSYLEEPNEELALSALFALQASRDARAAHWIAALLRGSSAPLRAAALQALGDFDEQDARRLLRDTLRGDNVQSASSAALALAELGTDRDVEALLRAAERGSWPLQPSAAYAAARITQRAQTRKHSLERGLCRFAQQRDTYVLANSVSALAALGAAACDEQITPSALLDASLPSALRVAAASWLRATQAADPQRAQLLARCAEDHDPAVARACTARKEATEGPGRTLLKLFEPDSRTPLRGRMVALRLPNASVFIGRSDEAGQLLLSRAVDGELVLEDPADSGALVLPLRAAPESP